MPHSRKVSGGVPPEQCPHDREQLFGVRANGFAHKPVERGGGIHHFPGHDAAVAGVEFWRQHALEERADEGLELFVRSKLRDRGPGGKPLPRQPALLGQDLGIEGRLVAEVVVHRRHVRLRPPADVADGRVAKARPANTSAAAVSRACRVAACDSGADSTWWRFAMFKRQFQTGV